MSYLEQTNYNTQNIGQGRIALAGGGGSSSGGGGGGGGGSSFSSSSSYSSSGSDGGSDGTPLSDFFSAFCAFGLSVIVFWGICLVIYSVIYSASKKTLKSYKALDNNPITAPLANYAKNIFIQYQKDWSAFNLANMRTYMTDHYYQHNELMMGAMRLAKRQNQVDDINVRYCSVLKKQDYSTGYTAALNISATDITNDMRDGGLRQPLFTQNVRMTQYYKFVKGSDGKYYLDGIDNSTAAGWTYEGSLEQFANQNGYFYSLDWGWLLLPQAGQLFGKGKFGTSDINNHVIGRLESTNSSFKPDETIFQLYTYTPNPNVTYNDQAISYLVAQVAVDRDYGDILVRRKKLFSAKPRNLTKLETEWGQFNDKFEVFASSTEKATSFELLNPTFMEKLVSAPFEINIEVADNMLYMYTKNRQANPSNYSAMLNVLQEAYREMRV